MSVTDDFAMWEEELADITEPTIDKSMAVTAPVLLAGSGLLIALGVTVLGIATLVILALIVVLWRAGM